MDQINNLFNGKAQHKCQCGNTEFNLYKNPYSKNWFNKKHIELRCKNCGYGIVMNRGN